MEMRKLLIISLLLAPIFAIQAEGEVDLLWQGEVYVPPFYQGRSLWSNESRITVTAVSNVPAFDPSTLYYRWSKDGKVLGNLSGINKHSLTFVDSILSLPIEIKVDLRDGEEGKVLGSSTLVVEPVQARLLIMSKSPLYGLMLNRAIVSEYSLTEPEVTFAAIPLFARVPIRTAPALAFTWSTNTGETRTGADVTYRIPEGARGESSITLRMKNAGVLVEPAPKSFLVKFENETAF